MSSTFSFEDNDEHGQWNRLSTQSIVSPFLLSVPAAIYRNCWPALARLFSVADVAVLGISRTRDADKCQDVSERT